MAERIFFLLAGLAALALAGGVQAAPGEPASGAKPKAQAPATPMGAKSVPLPNSSLIDDPFKRLKRKEGQGDSPADRYQKCLDLILIDANEAFETASAWRDQGGGAPAFHCVALSLMELGHYGEGASRLEELASNPDAGEAALRVQILSQAGNGWLLEGQARRAIAAFTSGINLVKETGGIDGTTLIYDRARAYALIDQWGPAFQDLTDVLQARPRELSSLILRATAARQLRRHAQAAKDIEAALAISPHDPAALIERATQRMAQGNKAGARKDLLTAAVVGEKTPMAEIAQGLLAQLDVDTSDVGQPADPISRTPIKIEPSHTGPRVARAEPVAETPRTPAAAPSAALEPVIAEPEPGWTYPDHVPLPVARPATGSTEDLGGVSLRTRIKR